MVADTTTKRQWVMPDVYDRYSGDVQHRNASILATMLPLASTPLHTLEIGCGTGLLTLLIRLRPDTGPFVAIDPSIEMLTVARNRTELYSVDFRCCRFPDCELDGGFDRIYSNAAFHWTYPHYVRSFERIRQLLNVDGIAIIGTAGRTEGSDMFDEIIQRAVIATRLPRLEPEFSKRRLSSSDLSSYCESAGLAVVESFVIERQRSTSIRQYVEWLLASGGPIDLERNDPSDVCKVLETALTQVGCSQTIEFGHWALFGVIKRAD